MTDPNKDVWNTFPSRDPDRAGDLGQSPDPADSDYGDFGRDARRFGAGRRPARDEALQPQPERYTDRARDGYGAYGRRPSAQTRSWWDEATDEVASWLGDDAARRRRRFDDVRRDQRGRGPKGYSRSDDRIRDEIAHRMTEDAWLDASRIELVVEAGEVTLNGAVADRGAKRHAEDLCESVAGVRHVQNNLRPEGR